MGETALRKGKPHAAEIAERVGVSRVTVNKWINAENWEHLKVSVTITKEEQLKNLYRQLAELNGKIAQREQGQRFPNAAEADTSPSWQTHQEDGNGGRTGGYHVRVRRPAQWLRTYDAEQAKQVCPLLDAFVKSKLA